MPRQPAGLLFSRASLLELMCMGAVTTMINSWAASASIRRGWQHDSKDPVNPDNPPVKPQKVPGS